MNCSLIRCSILLALLFCLSSWGDKAHRKINSSSVDYFPKEISGLKDWSGILGDHASDADNRKKNDKNEFVRHFIDIDLYDDFLQSNRMEENFEAACDKYGRAKVIKDGTLPWVTDSTYKALVLNFQSKNWQQAQLTAADLGHYVGDGFMPLHICANYNGQLSDQTGIHSRFEEKMIDQYIGSVNFKASRIKKVSDIQSYVFRYLYSNYSYLSMLLNADSKALKMSDQQYNETYYENLWKESGVFTTQLLQESSKTLAQFIYFAWLEAGKPTLPDLGVKK